MYADLFNKESRYVSGLNLQIFIATSNVRKSSEAEAGILYLGGFKNRQSSQKNLLFDVS